MWGATSERPKRPGNIEKPSLGIVPRKFHSEERVYNILEAVDRKVQQKQPIPMEWIEEYNDLTKHI